MLLELLQPLQQQKHGKKRGNTGEIRASALDTLAGSTRQRAGWQRCQCFACRESWLALQGGSQCTPLGRAWLGLSWLLTCTALTLFLPSAPSGQFSLLLNQGNGRQAGRGRKASQRIADPAAPPPGGVLIRPPARQCACPPGSHPSSQAGCRCLAHLLNRSRTQLEAPAAI
jgi:hypothetical protein